MSRLSREIPKNSLELLLRIFNSGLTIAFTEYGGKVFDGLGNDPAWFQLLGGMMQASIEWQTKQERIVGGFDVDCIKFKFYFSIPYLRNNLLQQLKL